MPERSDRIAASRAGWSEDSGYLMHAAGLSAGRALDNWTQGAISQYQDRNRAKSNRNVESRFQRMSADAMMEQRLQENGDEPASG
jgi:hypothetical protein